MKLAVIPARGGSKRIPRKNIKLFAGRPMIAWSIIAAIESACFDRIIVSTDDHEVAKIAQLHGAEVPFMRPQELSDDYTGIVPVIANAIDWQNKNGISATQVCCILATAPFVQVGDLQLALQMLLANKVDYAFSVTKYSFPIQRAIHIDSNSRVKMFQPEHFNSRSQDLEEAWHDAGQFYWGQACAWLDHRPIFSPSAIPVVIPRFRVQDIDTLEDWEQAERMFQCFCKFNMESS